MKYARMAEARLTKKIKFFKACSDLIGVKFLEIIYRSIGGAVAITLVVMTIFPYSFGRIFLFSFLGVWAGLSISSSYILNERRKLLTKKKHSRT